MIPENLPVFHIDLDCEFESSDNVFPSYPKNDQSPKSLADLTTLSQSETSTIFTSIGHRKDNLDRVTLSLFSASCSRARTSPSSLSLTDIAILSLLTISQQSWPPGLPGILIFSLTQKLPFFKVHTSLLKFSKTVRDKL